MKSRLALLSMIVLGLMMSTTGATLAITGSSGSGSAGIAQYFGAPDGDDQEVLGDTDGQGTQPQDSLGDEENAGDDGSGTEPQAAQQVAATGDGGGNSLPFTGFLAIPLLIGGVALVGTGAVLRRRVRD